MAAQCSAVRPVESVAVRREEAVTEDAPGPLSVAWAGESIRACRISGTPCMGARINVVGAAVVEAEGVGWGGLGKSRKGTLPKPPRGRMVGGGVGWPKLEG